MEEIKCEQIGMLSGGKWDKLHDQSRRVYSADGLAPIVHTMGGGLQELKIAEPVAYDEQNGNLRQDGCVGTLTTDGSSPKHNNRVVEPRICAMRGRNPNNPSDRTAGSPTEQRLEIGNEETSNALTTVQKDNLVVEPNCRFFEQAFETLQNEECEAGDTIDAYNKKVNKDGVSPTITTRPEGFKTAILPITQDYRIRKLTERECFRLMGVKSEDFERVTQNQSTSSCYHLAGDAICVSVLMAIFGKLFGVSDNNEKINNLVNALKQGD